MSKQARKLRRIISLLLAAVMAVSCFQLSAAAACEKSGADSVSKIMLSALCFLKKSQALYRSHTRGDPTNDLILNSNKKQTIFAVYFPQYFVVVLTRRQPCGVLRLVLRKISSQIFVHFLSEISIRKLRRHRYDRKQTH